MHDDRSIEEYKKLSQQVKYNGKDNCDIVEDYKKLLQQLKEYKGENNMYDERTIEVYKKLLNYTASYCETNYKYYSKPDDNDYNIEISYKGNTLITLQHSSTMKRSADDIAGSIAGIISDIFKTVIYHKRYFSEDTNGDYMLSLDDTGGFAVKVTKKKKE
nr:MAG TPA: hypothetical protein [Caudoviricetes sp.]